MNDGVTRAAERFYRSAITAGAMHRIFIGAGAPPLRDALCAGLAARGLEIIPGEFSPLAIWPEAFNRHQGTHFNRKLFVMNGLDGLWKKLGDDFFKRIRFERKALEKTAAWSLLWFESAEAAGRFRDTAPEVWGMADGRAVFLPDPLVSTAAAGEWTCGEAVVGGLGDLKIPSRITGCSLGELFSDLSNPETRFWGDLLRLSPPDAFLSAAQAFSSGKAVSPEMLEALAILAGALGMETTAHAARGRITAAPPPVAGESTSTWAGVGEAALKEAEEVLAARGPEAALPVLNRLLDGSEGWLARGAYLLADRPLRSRALLLRAAGRISEAAADIDRWEEITRRSGLDILAAQALEARAYHVEDLGDAAQAERWRAKAAELSGS